MPKVYLATDHAGFKLKNNLVEFIRDLDPSYDVQDMGAFELDLNDDYPDYIGPCARAIAADPTAIGVILGGSGQGEAMVANRVAGVRAAVFYGGSLELVTLARQHNNANVLSLAARFVTEQQAHEAVMEFLNTPFSAEERHVRRLKKF